jgi:hypothetical protein
MAPHVKILRDFRDRFLFGNTVGDSFVRLYYTYSPPLADIIEKTIDEKNLTVASVLSGNRNFEGRIHAKIKANYLASPMLVVAYALAGTVRIDFKSEAIGIGKDGKAIFLKDIWPTSLELEEAVIKANRPDFYTSVGALSGSASEDVYHTVINNLETIYNCGTKFQQVVGYAEGDIEPASKHFHVYICSFL